MVNPIDAYEITRNSLVGQCPEFANRAKNDKMNSRIQFENPKLTI